MPEAQRSLGDRILTGVVWIGAGRMAVRGIAVISTLILARLLTPEDFGLVAVAMALVGILGQMSSFGFNAALIHFQEASNDDYSTAWTLNLLRGLFIASIMLAIASPVAHFYGDPRLMPLIIVLAAIPLIQGLENTRFIDFEKEMDFRYFSGVMVAVKVLTFIVTISIAVSTRSYWALIAGNIVSPVFRIALTYMLRPFRPRFTLVAWRKLMGFSGWLMGANTLQGLNKHGDELVLRVLMSTHVVGIFFIAKDLVRTSINEIIAPVRRALFPGLSQLAPGSRRFREVYLSAVSGLFMVVAPMGCGVALVAPEAVPVLLGQQWLEAVTPIQVFGCISMIGVLGQPAVSTAMASGNTRMWFARTAIQTPVRLAFFLTGAYYYGLEGAIAGLFLASLFATALGIAMANRIVGSSITEHVVACRRSLGALILMTVVLVAIDLAVPPLPATALLPTLLLFIVKILAGAIAYTATHFLLWVMADRPAGPETSMMALAQSGWQKLRSTTLPDRIVRDE